MEWVTFIEDSSHDYVLIAKDNLLHVQAGFTGLASFKTCCVQSHSHKYRSVCSQPVPSRAAEQ
jgi:hypothetical protein